MRDLDGLNCKIRCTHHFTVENKQHVVLVLHISPFHESAPPRCQSADALD